MSLTSVITEATKSLLGTGYSFQIVAGRAPLVLPDSRRIVSFSFRSSVFIQPMDSNTRGTISQWRGSTSSASEVWIPEQDLKKSHLLQNRWCSRFLYHGSNTNLKGSILSALVKNHRPYFITSCGDRYPAGIPLATIYWTVRSLRWLIPNGRKIFPADYDTAHLVFSHQRQRLVGHSPLPQGTTKWGTFYSGKFEFRLIRVNSSRNDP